MDPEPPLLLAAAFDAGMIVPVLVLFLLLAASALISGSEVALFSLKPSELEELDTSSSQEDKKLLDLLEHPKTLLATILISNNFINVGIVILSSFVTHKLIDFTLHPTLAFVVEAIAITFVLLLFGEVLPKVYATRNALLLGRFMSTPLTFLRSILYPFSKVLVRSTQFLDKRLKRRTANLSVDDLSQALELTSEPNSQEDQRILEGIVKFGSTTVKQAMRSRMDVVAIEKSWDFNQVMSTILEAGYSRIPVYQEHFDQIEGVLYVKDLIPYIEAEEGFDWKQLMRQPFFVPENKKIDDLLREFQDKKVHLAIVVDEFGGTSGIITLEDVIEEIVGDISDEFDDEELVYSKLDERTYVFEGKIPLKDFYKVLNLDEEPFEQARGEADTLAGLVLELAGKFPGRHEEIKFNNYKFVVEALDKRRLQRIKVSWE